MIESVVCASFWGPGPGSATVTVRLPGRKIFAITSLSNVIAQSPGARIFIRSYCYPASSDVVQCVIYDAQNGPNNLTIENCLEITFELEILFQLCFAAGTASIFFFENEGGGIGINPPLDPNRLYTP